MHGALQFLDPGLVTQTATPFPGVDTGASTVTQLLGSAVTAFLTTLLVGAILIAVAEPYTRARMAEVLEDPVGSFLYGLISIVFLVLAIVVLVITIVGILVALPLALLAYVVWAVGASIAFLAIGDRLVGTDDGWAKPLLVGAAINGGLTVTGIGGILSFAIGAAGFGAVLKNYLA